MRGIFRIFYNSKFYKYFDKSKPNPVVFVVMPGGKSTAYLNIVLAEKFC